MLILPIIVFYHLINPTDGIVTSSIISHLIIFVKLTLPIFISELDTPELQFNVYVNRL